MHRSGRPRLGKGEGLEKATYSDTKLMDILLANALARRWEGTEFNSLDPGWVPTKLGGWGAPGDIEMGVDTYVMLALGEGEAKGKTGKYFRDSKEQTPAREALDVRLQDRLLEELARISGVALDGE
jgi:NAD(P)-dependent dehydrogenase (short-subunit alcohol dehydrogenase family)